MLIDRRMFVAGLCALPLAGCATSPSAPNSQNLKAITLVDAFEGRKTGSGVFKVPVAGVTRSFTAKLNGTLKGNTFTVVEDFVYDDGEKQTLTWRFVRTGSNKWDGRREDTLGVAKVVETGTEVRLDYVADVLSKGKVTRLGFSDVIYRTSDGKVINDAIVLKAGLPIGSVRFEIIG